jgi:serine carboxypeptidase 1
MMFITFLLFLFLASEATAQSGYVQVRPNANMFWWLLKAGDDTTNDFQGYPLVIWLQGGPGASSTGFGNFGEIGPYQVDLQPRKNTWLNHANLLFIDNPVGSGYSYVTSDDAYVRNNTQIAIDLVAGLNGFLKDQPEFQVNVLFSFI